MLKKKRFTINIVLYNQIKYSKFLHNRRQNHKKRGREHIAPQSQTFIPDFIEIIVQYTERGGLEDIIYYTFTLRLYIVR